MRLPAIISASLLFGATVTVAAPDAINDVWLFDHPDVPSMDIVVDTSNHDYDALIYETLVERFYDVLSDDADYVLHIGMQHSEQHDESGFDPSCVTHFAVRDASGTVVYQGSGMQHSSLIQIEATVAAIFDHQQPHLHQSVIVARHTGK
ncbi:hypothetical protein [Aestuariibacter salexigens]|uniref:hypothetical protein n=1 Tax=Aestuariibacter salexigens TaxID=226010 RepID=UPI0003FE082E|nr:hypothetical protein [Aestuariibacter salexigens]